MCILSTNNLNKTYTNGIVDVNALCDINLTVEEGTFTAIIGKSGSGKSTLLNILGGIDLPTKGKVTIEGTSLYSLSDKELAMYRRKRIGFVFQSYNLLSEFSVYHNICMPAFLDDIAPNTEYINDIINCLGIQDKIHAFPDELSGGEQQRVAIARALSMKPAIILADEPTGNLDNKTGHEIFSLLKLSQTNFKQTILLVTHDLTLARSADRIITIEDGSIVNDLEGLGND